MIHCHIHLYKLPLHVEENHAYLLAAKTGGLSGPLGSLLIKEHHSGRDLRRIIEIGEEEAGPSLRRTILFRELLYEFENATNLHRWPSHIERSSYRLGYLVDGSTEPAVIPLEQEERRILDILKAQGAPVIPGGSVDVVVIPITQIGPGCQKVCGGCQVCEISQRDGGQTRYLIDGVVQTTESNFGSNQ